MKHSESYKDCSCGGDCWLFNHDDPEKYGPCWGQAEACDEYPSGCDEDGNPTDWEWVHACKGHGQMYDGLGCTPNKNDYIEEPKND
jgi:hypothetical protein